MTEKNEACRAALYCRLSRDDGDNAESCSIVNQRRLLEDFCAHDPELTVSSVYVDDGFTGTNFNRPDFRRMLADIEDGKVDCVIVKDLSRFGRDYIDVGFYLERFFPAKHVRFIAVNDGIDSRRGPYDMMLPLRNVLNAQYARDTSDKVRKALHARQRRGEFVGAFAPYGYRKDPDNRNRLVVDPDAAEVVRYIFGRKAQGETNRGIARLLDQNGTLSPIAYKRSRGVRLNVNQKYRGTCHWSDSAVRRILANEMYLGNMVCNRYPSDQMHGKQRLAPRSEWIVTEGTHEPIISWELWSKAHESQPANMRKPGANAVHAGSFSGFLRCGDCGRALVRKGGNSYLCSSYRAYGEAACSKHAISGAVLEDIVLADVNRAVSQVGDLEKLTRTEDRKGALKPDGAAERARAALAKLRRQKRSAYEAYRTGRMTREAYMRRKEDWNERERTLAETAERPKEREETAGTPWVKRLMETGRIEKLDRLVLERTVREIRVFEGRRIEVDYLWRDHHV